METATIPKALIPLVEKLDALTQRASVEQLDQWLRELRLRFEDLVVFARFGEQNYRRNLVCAGEWYHLLVICWRSTQRSPIHNHATSTCGVRVLKGVATETKFEVSPCGLMKAVLSQDMKTGDIVVTHDADTHQMSNLQSRGQDLVTLHIYSPPLLKMDTFSLTDAGVTEYRPIIYEFSSGDGI